MGWLQNIFGSKANVSSAGVGQRINSSEAQKILDLINDYVATNGGLANVLKGFEDKGFVKKVRSWIATGPNDPINSIEALQLFGYRNLSALAEKAGLSVERLRDLIAELLPVAIDKATPEGKTPARG